MTDLSKTNQELIAEISDLKKRIQELENLEAGRKRVEEMLRERNKELNCLYGISALFESPGISLDEILKRTVMLIPPAWQFPEITEASIVLEGKIFQTARFRETSWMQTSEVVLNGMPVGQVEVCYLEKRQVSDEGPFLKEERKLLNAIAERVGRIIDRKQAEEALRKNEELYRSLSENSPSMIFLLDVEGNVLVVNQQSAAMFGVKSDAMIGRNIRDLFPQQIAERHKHAIDKVVRDGNIIHSELSEPFPTGERWIDARIVPVWNKENSKIIAVLGISHDITDRKRAEEALRESEERYRTLVENANDIVFRLDDTGHITFVNPAALSIMGYEEKEIIGRHYPTFIRPDMREEAMKFFGRQFVKGIPNTYSEYPVIVKDGREIWLGQNTQLICQDDKVVAFQAVARDITERKRIGEALQDSENRYRELSIIDDLTQLYNSRYFHHQLKIEINRVNRYEQPLTLMLLDLDDFKVFNDAYGHVEGDQVLMRLGQVIKRCLRQADSGYRYGGEEFTIIMPMTTSEGGAVTAERIRSELKEEIFSPEPGKDVSVTVSIGLAQCKPREDIKTFVNRVDHLMYKGKKNGKDRVCFAP